MRVFGIVLLSLVSTLVPLSMARGQDTPQAPKGQEAGTVEPVVAVIKTSMGEIKLELNAELAPITVDNFVKYAKSGHYAGTIFHRVIKNFMIQGGGMDEKMKEKATMKPIRNESANGLKNDKYTIAMARTGDPNSATSQFFINTVDNAPLNKARAQDGHGYAVFGKVVEGQAVVDAIAAVPVRSVGVHGDVPRDPIYIESVEIIERTAESAPAPAPAPEPEVKKDGGN